VVWTGVGLAVVVGGIGWGLGQRGCGGRGTDKKVHPGPGSRANHSTNSVLCALFLV